jgi:membrane protein YqaA with SNARE-associated domain
VKLAWKLLTIFFLGLTELWAAAPAGLLMRLNPLLVCGVAALGQATGGATVILLGERVKVFLQRRRQSEKLQKRPGLLYRVWQRYGVAGWGLMAPLLIGSPLGAAIGLLLNVPPRHLLIWLGVGSFFWSMFFSVLAVMGIHFLGR